MNYLCINFVKIQGAGKKKQGQTGLTASFEHADNQKLDATIYLI